MIGKLQKRIWAITYFPHQPDFEVGLLPSLVAALGDFRTGANKEIIGRRGEQGRINAQGHICGLATVLVGLRDE
jgi:hypothetical protein